MGYQLSRRALNASYSDRRVKLGKPHKSLPSALLAASKAPGDDIRVTETVTGQWARVHTVSEYRTWLGADRSPHVVLELPVTWATELLGGLA